MPVLSFIQVYAIAAGSVLAVIAFRYSFARLWHYYFQFWFNKYLRYPLIIIRHRYFGPVTRIRLILEIGCWALVAVLAFVDCRSMGNLGADLGTFALVFFVPLVFAGDITLASYILDTPMRLVKQVHTSLGILALALTFLHAVISGTQRKNFSLADNVWLYGIVAGVSLLLLPLNSLLKRRYYSIYLRLHQLLVMAAVVSLWFHTMQSEESVAKGYIIATGVLFLLSQSSYVIMFLLNNYKWAPITVEIKRRGRQTELHEDQLELGVTAQDEGASHVTLTIGFMGNMKIKAGQHIILYVPALTGLQGHLLPISWWSLGYCMAIDSILDPNHQLAKALRKKQLSSTRAYFTGPHGCATDMDSYGSIILIATGSGISAQLSHVKQLIAARDDGVSRTRQVHLIWQFETWDDFIIEAQSRLTDLLEEDRSMSSHVKCLAELQKATDIDQSMVSGKSDYLKALDEVIKRSSHTFTISLHLVNRRPSDPSSFQGKGENGEYIRLREHYGLIPYSEVLPSLIQGRKGKLLILASASGSARDKIRHVVNQNLCVGLDYEELEFQPSEEARSSATQTDLPPPPQLQPDKKSNQQ